MFSLASGVYQSYFAAPQLNVLVIGCESVGKTALLERLKVTEFSKKSPRTGAGGLSCPAPNRYVQARLPDEDIDMGTNEHCIQGNSLQQNGSSQLLAHRSSSLESMEDVSLLPTTSQPHELEQEGGTCEEFNVKPGHSMFPMLKIMPTSGTNLAKVPICGCICKFFDVSGKFQDLWVKYYGDSDAVVFCWRLGWNEEHQRTVLEDVRRQIDDDIPVLIFGHIMEDTHENLLPTCTSFFISHYTSNMMQVFCGSAKTGQGVKGAMEWLIPLARRQIQLKASSAK